MRRTGSRESRDKREASATSPTSMAVNTFSIRFGSRRNQRPVHQKIRSITTVKAQIDASRIGNIIGPPLWYFSISQFPLPASEAGEALGEGDAPTAGEGARLPLNVALTVVPSAGEAPGIP